VVTESEWIPLGLNVGSSIGFFAWTGDSKRLFFLGATDRPYSIFTVPFDPVTGKSIGQPALVINPEGSQHIVGDRALIGLTLIGDRLYFSIVDSHANIGIAEMETPVK
jgi:hypothetical protein